MIAASDLGFHPLAGKRNTKVKNAADDLRGKGQLMFPSPCGEAYYGSMKMMYVRLELFVSIPLRGSILRKIRRSCYR